MLLSFLLSFCCTRTRKDFHATFTFQFVAYDCPLSSTPRRRTALQEKRRTQHADIFEPTKSFSAHLSHFAFIETLPTHSFSSIIDIDTTIIKSSIWANLAKKDKEGKPPLERFSIERTTRNKTASNRK